MIMDEYDAALLRDALSDVDLSARAPLAGQVQRIRVAFLQDWVREDFKRAKKFRARGTIALIAMAALVLAGAFLPPTTPDRAFTTSVIVGGFLLLGAGIVAFDYFLATLAESSFRRLQSALTEALESDFARR